MKTLRCLYCGEEFDSGALQCHSCGESAPWSKEIEALRDAIKSREISRPRALLTLTEEVVASLRGGPPVSLAAIKGAVFAWLFPRALIVVGSLAAALILGAQTFVMWKQSQLLEQQNTVLTDQNEMIAAQTTLLHEQTSAASSQNRMLTVEFGDQLRDRIDRFAKTAREAESKRRELSLIESRMTCTQECRSVDLGALVVTNDWRASLSANSASAPSGVNIARQHLQNTLRYSSMVGIALLGTIERSSGDLLIQMLSSSKVAYDSPWAKATLICPVDSDVDRLMLMRLNLLDKIRNSGLTSLPGVLNRLLHELVESETSVRSDRQASPSRAEHLQYGHVYDAFKQHFEGLSDALGHLSARCTSLAESHLDELRAIGR